MNVGPRVPDECAVAVKIDGRWHSRIGAQMTLAEARAAYDAGTHTLSQGRGEGGNMLLFAIPLKVRVKRSAGETFAYLSSCRGEE